MILPEETLGNMTQYEDVIIRFNLIIGRRVSRPMDFRRII